MAELGDCVGPSAPQGHSMSPASTASTALPQSLLALLPSLSHTLLTAVGAGLRVAARLVHMQSVQRLSCGWFGNHSLGTLFG